MYVSLPVSSVRYSFAWSLADEERGPADRSLFICHVGSQSRSGFSHTSYAILFTLGPVSASKYEHWFHMLSWFSNLIPLCTQMSIRQCYCTKIIHHHRLPNNKAFPTVNSTPWYSVSMHLFLPSST